MTQGTPRGHVLVACDKFKGSLTAAQVAAAVRAGLMDADPGRHVTCLAVADGGDGTLDAAVSTGFERVPVTVTGPTGEPVRTAYARRGTIAVVEMADACGLARLPGSRPAPMTASSRGLGEAVAAALDAGADDIVLAVGGSASTDGGAGMLAALGARFVDASGADLPDGGAALAALDSVDLTGLHPALAHTRVTLASDVDNPLVGERGTVAVFAAQKGATSTQRDDLETALNRYARLVDAATRRTGTHLPGAGAAGGVGYAALTVLDATMRPGVELVLDLLRFDDLLQGAELVITGEGCLDTQTLLGKAPAGVAAAARRRGVPVVAVCGRCLLTPAQAASAGIDRVYPLTDLEPDPHVCMRDAPTLLRRVAARIQRHPD